MTAEGIEDEWLKDNQHMPPYSNDETSKNEQDASNELNPTRYSNSTWWSPLTYVRNGQYMLALWQVMAMSLHPKASKELLLHWEAQLLSVLHFDHPRALATL